MQGEPKHALVITADEGVEGRALALLGLADQFIVLDALLSAGL
jgi:hypothetical protein